MVNGQVEEVIKAKGPGNLQDLLTGDETWVVE